MSLPSPSMPLACLLTALLLGGCGADDEPLRAEPGEHLSGGATTVLQSDRNAFSALRQPPPSRRLTSAWATVSSATPGSSPLPPPPRATVWDRCSITNACQNCHVKDGRGHPPGADAVSAVSMLVRLSIPAGPADGKTLLHQGDSRADLRRPVAGRRHSRRRPGRQGAGGLRAAEGEVRGRHRGRTAQADPAYQPARLWADASADDVFRPRRPADDRARPARGDSRRGDPGHADPDDRNGDGIRGRANQVWDAARQRTALGRFGWKAGQPDIPQQNAHAFANDMGLDQQPAAPRRPQRRPGRAPPGARRRRAGSQRQHLRPGVVLQPQPGGPGAAQGGRPAGAGRQAPVRPGQLRGLPRSRLHYRFRRQRAGAGQPTDSSLFRPVAA